MSDHARLSPSARYRWSACPASVRACLQYKGSDKSSPAAIDGTHSHTLLEHCIKHAAKGTVDDPKKFLGMALQDKEGLFGVNEDRVERVRIATDYLNRRLGDLGAHTEVHSEKRVDPALLLGRSDMKGTVDVQLLSDTFLEVIDYKDGMNKVSAVGNQQLEQYVFGVLADLTARGVAVTKVRMTIIQPKASFGGNDPISSHEIDAAEFFGERIEKIIREAEATDAKDAPFVPGEKQCTYCAHRGACTAAITHSLKQSGIQFKDMNFAKDAATKDESTMTDEQLKELVEAGPLLRKLIEGAENEALRRIESGHPVDGLKVVRGRGTRSWALLPEETAAKLSKMGLPKDMIWKASLITPAQVEKAKWEKRDGSVKQLTERQLKVLENDLIAVSQGKMTVVSEADGRAAVVFPNLKEAFDPVPELPSWLS